MHGETTKSDKTEVESPALIPSGNKSETPNTSKVHGLNFDSDSDTELLAIPQHPIISERKQVQLALQMSLKEQQSTPKKSGRGKVQATLSMESWMSRSTAESTRLRSKGVISTQGRTSLL